MKKIIVVLLLFHCAVGHAQFFDYLRPFDSTKYVTPTMSALKANLSTPQFTDQIGIGTAASTSRITFPQTTNTTDGISWGDILLYRMGTNRIGVGTNTFAAGSLQLSNSIFNSSSNNNAQVNPSTTGTIITRNVADANTALIVNQSNASSTGLIFDAQFGGTTKANISTGGALITTGTITSGGSLVSGGGIIASSSTSAFSNLLVTSGQSAISQSTATLLLSGWTGITTRISERGASTPTVTASDAYVSHIIGTQVAAENSTGTHPFMGQVVIRPLSVTNAGAATTEAATVYIEGPTTGITPTGANNTLKVAAGNTSLAALSTAIVAKTGAYTATSSDHTITGDATSAAFTVTLPTAIGIAGQEYVVKKIDASANAVTIGTTSSQTIDGSTTYSLGARWKFATVQSDGSNWLLISAN